MDEKVIHLTRNIDNRAVARQRIQTYSAFSVETEVCDAHCRMYEVIVSVVKLMRR